MYRTLLSKKELDYLSNRRTIISAIHLFIHYLVIFILIVSANYFYQIGEIFILSINILVLGIFYSFLGWSGMGHELLHGTFFKSYKVNKIFLALNSIFLLNNWSYHKKSHIIHHRLTLTPGKDFEFNSKQPLLDSTDLVLSLTFDFLLMYRKLKITILNSLNVIPGSFAELHLPVGSKSRMSVVFSARLILLYHLLMFLISYAYQNPIVFLCSSIAPFCCTFPARILALGQHIGMKEGSNDFRENSRSVYLPKLISFLYCNMNYHVEHHMYPSVPYYNLPKLRSRIEYDLPQPIKFSELIFICLKVTGEKSLNRPSSV